MLFPFRLDRLVKFTSKKIRCPNSGNPQELFDWRTKTNGWILYIPEKCTFLNPQVMEVWFNNQLHLEFLPRVQPPSRSMLPWPLWRNSRGGPKIGPADFFSCKMMISLSRNVGINEFAEKDKCTQKNTVRGLNCYRKHPQTHYHINLYYWV